MPSMLKSSSRPVPPKSRDTPQSDMSVTSIGSRPGILDRTTRSLKTPIRRLFFKLDMLKPYTSKAGTKRTRAEKQSQPLLAFSDYIPTLDPIVDTPPPSSDTSSPRSSNFDTLDEDIIKTVSPVQHYTPPIPCMALQNSDTSIDAVVISTLLKLPFCCHEDLLTMPDARAIEVAQEFNDRLPEALRIDLSGSIGVTEIRREIEWLVGIVKKANQAAIPGAPLKRTKGRRNSWVMARTTDVFEELDLMTISPPTSPLAMISTTRRTKRRPGEDEGTSMTMITPTRLTMLLEEEEDLEDEVVKPRSSTIQREPHNTIMDVSTDEDVFRATKKRRTSDFASTKDNITVASPSEVITRTMGRRFRAPLMLEKLYNAIDSTPTPKRVLKYSAQIQTRVGDDDDGVLMPLGASAVIREEARVIVKTTVIDRSLVNTRPRYRSSSSRPLRFQTVPQIGQDGQEGPLQTSTPPGDLRRRWPI